MSKVIVVIGASSGIGLATIKVLYERQYRVIGVARTISKLKLPFKTFDADITNDHQIEALFRDILDQEGRVDVLINCAGYSLAGPVEEITSSEMKKQFETNFFGSLTTIRQVIGPMRTNGGGLIINVSSIGGVMGLPYQGAYSASKFALEGLSESLNSELAKDNIKVRLVLPGDTRTPLTDNRVLWSGFSSQSRHYNTFSRVIKRIRKDELSGMSVDKVARRIVKLVESSNPGFRTLIGSFAERLAVFLKVVLPYRLFESILKKHYQV